MTDSASFPRSNLAFLSPASSTAGRLSKSAADPTVQQDRGYGVTKRVGSSC
jgi:hypothetical protein